jgi:hypothetical protein
MKKIKFLVIFFCCLFLCGISGAYTTDYISLNDIGFSHKNELNIMIHHNQKSLEIDYVFYAQNYEFKTFVDSNIIPLSESVFGFAESKNMDFDECVDKEHLEIYQISQQILNDQSRFNGWQVKSDGSEFIWGLYDPRVGAKIIASIMITDHGEKENRLIFAHELSHYWYDRFCWNHGWEGSDEQFAMEFEKFYLKSENP